MTDPPGPEDRSLTQVTIISSDSVQPGATASIRSWEMPAALADHAAAWLTEMCGPPIEGLCSVGSAIDLAVISDHIWMSGGEDDGA